MTPVAVNHIIVVASRAEGADQTLVRGRSRRPEVCRARVRVMRRLRRCGLSDVEIGEALDRHSTTVRQALAPTPKKRPT